MKDSMTGSAPLSAVPLLRAKADTRLPLPTTELLLIVLLELAEPSLYPIPTLSDCSLSILEAEEMRLRSSLLGTGVDKESNSGELCRSAWIMAAISAARRRVRAGSSAVLLYR